MLYYVIVSWYWSQPVFCCGWSKYKSRTLVRVSGLRFLQRFDTDGWVAGWISGL